MNRSALALALVAVTSGVASAGTFLGLGIGTGPAANTSDVQNFEADGRSGKILGGMRWGNFSVEAALGGYDLINQNNMAYDGWQGSLAGKLSVPLGDGFEAFGRFGLQRTWLNVDRDDSFSVSGDGYLLGGGIEYRLNAIATNASIWIDYQYANADLSGQRDTQRYDLSTRMWTLGFSIGL